MTDVAHELGITPHAYCGCARCVVFRLTHGYPMAAPIRPIQRRRWWQFWRRR